MYVQQLSISETYTGILIYPVDWSSKAQNQEVRVIPEKQFVSLGSFLIMKQVRQAFEMASVINTLCRINSHCFIEVSLISKSKCAQF